MTPIRTFGATTVFAMMLASQSHQWRRGTLARIYRDGRFQVYEIDTNDTSTKRCIIVVREERGPQFTSANIKAGKTVRYAIEGTAVYFLDPDGNERMARIWKQKLMRRRPWEPRSDWRVVQVSGNPVFRPYERWHRAAPPRTCRTS